MKRVGVFVVAVALIVGMVGCDRDDDGNGTGNGSYTLTITSSHGGLVSAPGEGAYTYAEGTVVALVAQVGESYFFSGWTGDVGTIDDVRAAATTITMLGSYSITAVFKEDIEIRDWYDLDAISNEPDASYVLMNDLDSDTPGYQELAGSTANQGGGWQPIGTFAGTLAGQGYEIRDLFIFRPDGGRGGLFYFVEQGGLIEGLGLGNMSVTGQIDVGGLVGFNKGTVSDCYATGSVTGETDVGGLVGFNGNVGVVRNSYFAGSVSDGESFTGGLVGFNEGTVRGCYATGSVAGEIDVGGLVGFNKGTVNDCYATGSVAGDIDVGGLVGFNRGTVSECYATGGVTGNTYVGGLVGYNRVALMSCSDSGNVISSGSAGFLGATSHGTVSSAFWDIETSGRATSDGGTGKTTAKMKNVATFSDAEWSIAGVGSSSQRNPAYTWNIVDGHTYPFLSWEPVA